MIFIKYVYHNIFCRILYNIEQWSNNNTGSQKRFSLDIEMLFLRLDKEIIVLVMRFVISLFLSSHILNGLNMHILLFWIILVSQTKYFKEIYKKIAAYITVRIINHVYDKKKLTEFRNFNQMKNVSWVSIFNKVFSYKRYDKVTFDGSEMAALTNKKWAEDASRLRLAWWTVTNDIKSFNQKLKIRCFFFCTTWQKHPWTMVLLKRISSNFSMKAVCRKDLDEISFFLERGNKIL